MTIDLRAANPAVSLKLATVIEKLIEKDPSKRYQTAAAVKTDLSHDIPQ